MGDVELLQSFVRYVQYDLETDVEPFGILLQAMPMQESFIVPGATRPGEVRSLTGVTSARYLGFDSSASGSGATPDELTVGISSSGLPIGGAEEKGSSGDAVEPSAGTRVVLDL